MDLYSEKLELDIINLDENESQAVGEQSEINTESAIEKQASVVKTEVITESVIEKKASVPTNEVITESGIQKQAIVPKTEVITERQETDEGNPYVNIESGNGSQATCSVKEDTSSQSKDTSEPIGRKRRGRPPKEDLKDVKPTRESKRIKKCAYVMNYDSSSKMRCVWTNDEKWLFWRGLEECGVDNIKRLQTYVPGKTENEINNQIRMWKDFGQNDLEKKLTSKKTALVNAPINCIKRLNEWTQRFEELAEITPQKLFALSNVFLLISEYGEFPKPSQCEEIDFRAMYRYLHCMLNGKPYFGVNQRTAEVLHQSVSNMFAFLRRKACHNKLILHLLQMSQETHFKPPKTYNRVRTKREYPTSGLENPDAILRIVDMNPLNIPPHLLIKEKVPDEEDSDNNKTYFDNNDSFRTYDLPDSDDFDN